ncbi:secretoglobin family 1D member 2-like [Myotis lucifugus]|uniref:secretoglobin family 1D member 2-like n=1 Tax=Myotis lucifugus TaxID=59463 RepID=UPI0006D7172A|nr:secretoglobin family 1D member 2-like [Myotis lucifugus]
MKLALSLLLVTLALCCSDANAEVCPELTSVMSNFMLWPKERFNNQIQKFDAPAAAVQAALQGKTCVDKLSLWDRVALAQFVELLKILCNKQLI